MTPVQNESDWLSLITEGQPLKAPSKLQHLRNCSDSVTHLCKHVHFTFTYFILSLFCGSNRLFMVLYLIFNMTETVTRNGNNALHLYKSPGTARRKTLTKAKLKRKTLQKYYTSCCFYTAPCLNKLKENFL